MSAHANVMLRPLVGAMRTLRTYVPLEEGTLLRTLLGAMRTCCSLFCLPPGTTVANPLRGDEDPMVKLQVSGMIGSSRIMVFAANRRLCR